MLVYGCVGSCIVIWLCKYVYVIIQVSLRFPPSVLVLFSLFLDQCHAPVPTYLTVREGLYRIWCGVNRLGDSGAYTRRYFSFCYPGGSAIVNPAG